MAVGLLLVTSMDINNLFFMVPQNVVEIEQKCTVGIVIPDVRPILATELACLSPPGGH